MTRSRSTFPCFFFLVSSTKAPNVCFLFSLPFSSTHIHVFYTFLTILYFQILVLSIFPLPVMLCLSVTSILSARSGDRLCSNEVERARISPAHYNQFLEEKKKSDTIISRRDRWKVVGENERIRFEEQSIGYTGWGPSEPERIEREFLSPLFRRTFGFLHQTSQSNLSSLFFGFIFLRLLRFSIKRTLFETRRRHGLKDCRRSRRSRSDIKRRRSLIWSQLHASICFRKTQVIDDARSPVDERISPSGSIWDGWIRTLGTRRWRREKLTCSLWTLRFFHQDRKRKLSFSWRQEEFERPILEKRETQERTTWRKWERMGRR